MRDSFTDYMRTAPQQFENGIAIAKAAMATGSLVTAVAVADVAGGRPLSPASRQAAAGARRAPSPVLPSGAGYAVRVAADAADSQGSLDLIDLACAGYDGAAAPGSQQHSDQGDAVAAAATRTAFGESAGSVWGAAAQAASSAGGLPLYQQYQQQQSGRGGGGLLQGGLSVPNPLLEANASLALTSSICLLSSLPHHSSLPVGLLPESLLLQQQQYGGGGAHSAAAARAGFGASTSLARISGSSHGSSAFGSRAGSAIDAVHSGALLLPPVASGRGGIGGGAGAVSEDGSMTPTSSCCHDSVCTFTRGPGSAAGSSVAGSSRGGSGSAAGRTPPLPGRLSPVGGRSTSPADGAAAAAAGGGASVLSQTPSLPLSRSSWNSAVSSTELLMQSQTSSAI
jgi:hypothetical protein